MLSVFLTVTEQVAVLFILIAVGFALSCAGVINDAVRSGMTVILLDVVTPCVIVSEMQTQRTGDRMTGLLITAGVFAACLAVFILLSKPLAARKGRPVSTEASARICMIYSNCGFMGLPLLAALSDVVGSDALFYGSVIIGVNNLFLFTQGIAMFGKSSSGGEKPGVSRRLAMLFSPAVAGIFVGILLFSLGIELPEVISRPVEYIGSMNTPLAMLVIGAIIKSCDLRRIFTDRRIFLPVFVRNLLFPGLFLGVAALFNLNFAPVLVCLIIAACPTAGNGAVFSERYGGDSVLASGIFSLSTLFSAGSVPLITAAAAMI